MGTRSYGFPHEGSVPKIVNEVAKVATELGREHGMEVLRVDPGTFMLRRTGVEVRVVVQPRRLNVTVGLGWLAELFRGRLEDELDRQVPALLRRCEMPPATNGRG